MAYEWENSTLEQKKAKLQELQAKLAQAKMDSEYKQQRGGLTRAAEAMMPYDPTGAFNLLDKREALDVKRLQAEKDNQYDPDAVRFKLASRSNAISGQLAGMAANNPAYQPLLNEQNRIKKELAKDNPSIKDVYADQDTPTPTVVPGAITVATYDSIIANINAATKDTFESVKSQVATDKGVAKLSAEQEKRIDELLEERRKKLFPAAGKTDAQVVEEVKDKLTAEEFKGYSVPSSLYNAGISNMKLGTYGTAIQNFIKVANPGESVMSDDVNMANKGQVDSKLQVVLKRIGYDATNDNVQAIAYNLGITAQEAIKNKFKALDTYGFNPAQKALFVKRYMNSVDPYASIPRGKPTSNTDEAAGKPVLKGGKQKPTTTPNRGYEWVYVEKLNDWKQKKVQK